MARKTSEAAANVGTSDAAAQVSTSEATGKAGTSDVKADTSNAKAGTPAKIRKRGQGEGSIYQRSDGLWVAAISSNSGRKVAYAKTRKLAAEKLQALLQASAAGLPTPRKDITVEDLMDEYLEHKKPGWRPKTYTLAEGIIRLHVIPALGKTRLASLDARQIARWLRGISSPRSAINARAHLSAACELALRWEWLARNPVKLVDAPRYSPQRVEEVDSTKVMDYLTALKTCPHYPLLCVLVGCGLRIGEALGLCWEDIDLVAGVLRVRYQVGRSGGAWVRTELKTKSATRTAALPSFVCEALKARKVTQEAHRAKWPQWGNEWGLVFTTSRGNPPLYTDIRRQVLEAARVAGVEYTPYHQLRHAYASLLIDAQVPLPVVSAAMGHSSAAITMRVYAHQLKGAQGQTATVLDAVWEKNKAAGDQKATGEKS